VARLRDLFPRSHELGQAFDLSPENKDIQSDSELEVAVCFLVDLSLRAQNIDELHNQCQALFEDILKLKPSAQGHLRHVLDFAQFMIATRAASACLESGVQSRIFDWTAQSIVDEVVTGRVNAVFQISRLAEFVCSDDDGLAKQALAEVALWFETFFAYSTISGAFLALANPDTGLLRLAEHVLFNSGGIGVIATLQYFAWATKYSPLRAASALAFLHTAAQNAELPPEIRLRASISIALSASEDPSKALDVLSRYANDLRPQDRLQLRVQSFGRSADTIEANLKQLLGDVRAASLDAMRIALLQFPTNRITSPSLVRYIRSRQLNLIGAIVDVLAESGRCRSLTIVLSEWIGVAPDARLDNPLLIVLPTGPRGAYFCIEGLSTLHAAEDPVAQARELIAATNEFLGLTLTFLDDPNYVPSIPARDVGVPDESKAFAFERALNKQLKLQALAIPQDVTPTAMLMLFGGQYPIQALMRKEAGWTLPLVKSFEQPLADRTVLTVLLLTGESLYTELETNALAKLLRARGIQVEVATSPTERSGVDYDVVWVVGHGEFSHYVPHHSKIVLGSEETTAERLLAGLPETSTRRLLVLNLCDGGSTAWTGLHEMGLGVASSSRSLAVVSHLWPVDPLAAATFGVIFASHLLNAGGYFSAFTATLSVIGAGREVVLQHLIEVLGANDQLVGRVENRSSLFDTIFHWGSPVFFE